MGGGDHGSKSDISFAGIFASSAFAACFAERTPTVAMFLPKFNGNNNENPNSWIFRAELYFTYLGFDEKDWLPLPLFYLDGEALSWFNRFFCNKHFFDWNHFKVTFTQRFQQQKQQIHEDVLGRLTNSSQVHYDYVSSVPVISQSTMTSPSLATSLFAEPSAIASANNTGSSQADQVFDKMPANFQCVESVALIDKNITDVEPTEDTEIPQIRISVEEIEIPQIGNENSVEADLVHEPSSITACQVTRVISKPTWCSKIAYYDDTHSRKSVDEENECLETNSHLAFDESLQRNIFHLRGQFANLKLVVIGNSVFHEILNSDFDGLRGVDREVSLTPHDNNVEVVKFFLCLFNQLSLANIRNLAVCDSMADCVPTCYWFDTGQHAFQSSHFVFKHKRYGDHLSVMELDQNGYCPIFGAQGVSGKALFAIRSSKILASHIQTMGSSNSKVYQVFNAMSNEACKVFNATPTSLLIGVLIEIVKEERNYFLSSFGGRESIMPIAHCTRAPPMRYFVANSLYNDLPGQGTILMASDDLCADIISMKPPRIEDLYHDKQFLGNKVGFSRREIQFVGVRNDIHHEKFTEVKRHAEYLFPFYLGVNLFMVKLTETVLVNCVWDPGISSKTMHRNALNWLVSIQPNLKKIALNRPLLCAETSSETVSRALVLFGTNSLFQVALKNTMSLKEPPGAWCDIAFNLEGMIERENLSPDQRAYWYLTIIYVSSEDISFWVDNNVGLVININCMCAFECISVTGIVTCKWVKVVQPIKLVLEYKLVDQPIKSVAAAVTAMLQEWKVSKLSETKVKLQVVHPTGYTFYGVIKTVKLDAHHRLQQCLVAMKRFGRNQTSKIVHQYFKVDKFSFGGFDHVKEYCLYHISSESGASFDRGTILDYLLGVLVIDINTHILAHYVSMSLGREGIDAKKVWRNCLSYVCELLVVNIIRIPYVDTSTAYELKTVIYRCLNDNIRWFTLVDTFQFIIHPCYVILHKGISVPKLSKDDEVNSRILKVANQIIILFLGVFICTSQGIYNTPSCHMKFLDMNLEDKVLFWGGSIVVNLNDFIRAYGLAMTNKIDPIGIVGPCEMLESFIWDPGPIKDWLKGHKGCGRRDRLL